MNNPLEEPLFSDDQTKLLKSMMASAVAEAMASTSKNTEERLEKGNEPLNLAGEWLYTMVKRKGKTNA